MPSFFTFAFKRLPESMGGCVIGAIKSSLHFVFSRCRLLFDAFRRPIRLPESAASTALKRIYASPSQPPRVFTPVSSARHSVSAVCSVVSTSLAALSMMYIIFLCVTVDG